MRALIVVLLLQVAGAARADLYDCAALAGDYCGPGLPYCRTASLATVHF